MGKTLVGDDGLLAEEVGVWAKEKHQYLCRYIDISRSVRAKFLGHGKAGAAYIDLFCGPGRSKVRETGEWIDGGVVAAWKKSVESGTPFSAVYIGDLDEERRHASVKRLRKLGAPVVELQGAAVNSAETALKMLNKYGLNFAFLDPFDLAALDFEVIVKLSKLRHVDMLVHVSQMDLQRNAAPYATAEKSPFDTFAPGWREAVTIAQGQQEFRNQIFQFWRSKVADLGVWPSTDMRLLTGSKNQPLYWLLLASRHTLAHKFWATASNVEGQGTLGF